MGENLKTMRNIEKRVSFYFWDWFICSFYLLQEDSNYMEPGFTELFSGV